MSLMMRRLAIGLFASTCLAGSAYGQVGAEPGSQSPAINGDSSAVATRSPGRRLQDLLAGPTITETTETIRTATPDDNELRSAGIVGLITVLIALFNQTLPVLPALLSGGGNGGGGILTNNTIIITEMADDGDNAVVEIFNPGAIRVEMDDWAFCNSSECSNRLSNVVLESNDILVVQLDGNFDPTIANTIVSLRAGTETGEIGLYNFGSSPSDPTDGTSMVDYLQWGGLIGTFGLQEIAAQRGLWTRAENSSIDASLANNSFQLEASQAQLGGRRASDYIVVSFGTNSLGQGTPAGLSSDSGGAMDDMSDPGDSVDDVIDDIIGGGRDGRGR